MLQAFSDQNRVPEGWTVLCYIIGDSSDRTCRELLQDLPYVGDADGLLAQGGNFGCLLHFVHPNDPDSEPERGCRDGYQHGLVLDKDLCPTCVAMSVCMRY